MKGTGYFVSIISVFLLGIAAWPKPDEPQWKAILVALGMAMSIIGMALRFASHRKQRRELKAIESGRPEIAARASFDPR